MKIIRSLVSIAALLCLAFPTLGQGFQAGTATGATNAAFVASANRSGQPVVSYIVATSDLVGSTIQFWSAGSSVPVTATSAASQTTLYTTGASFSANDRVAIRAVSSDLYQVATVSSTTSTNVVLSTSLSRAVGIGDVLYKLTANGSIPLGSNTVTVAVPCHAGQEGKPLAITAAGTSAVSINTVLVEFKR